MVSLIASRATATEPNVIENSSHGLWDDPPRKNFHVLEELVVGGDDEEYDVVFGRIADIAVDSHGRIFVLDGGEVCVKVYNPDSLTTWRIGRKGEGPGEFNQPTAIAIDTEDRIYVASMGGRIAIFEASGELAGEFRHQFQGGGMVTDLRVAARNLYIACFDPVDDKIVHRYNGKHYVSSFSDSWSAVKTMPPDEEFAWNGGTIDIGSDGNVYYTQFTPYEIRKFSPTGELLLTIHRENDFKPPRIERKGDSVAFYAYSGSFGIFVLSDGKILNVANYVYGDDAILSTTIVDLFDADGRFLKSRNLERRVSIRCRDAKNYLYASEERDVPQVVRYRLQLP
jgi:6-bladed beta-propeller